MLSESMRYIGIAFHNDLRKFEEKSFFLGFFSFFEFKSTSNSRKEREREILAPKVLSTFSYFVHTKSIFFIFSWFLLDEQRRNVFVNVFLFLDFEEFLTCTY